MCSAATTDPEEARETFVEFQSYLERNQFGLAKLGSPLRKEVHLLIKRLERISHYLELAETGEGL